MNEIQITKPKEEGINSYKGMILIDQGGFVCIVCSFTTIGQCSVVRLEDGYMERDHVSYDRLGSEIEDGTYKIVPVGTEITLTVKGK